MDAPAADDWIVAGDVCGQTPRRGFPCAECPARADNADNPRSKFPASRWEALAATVAEVTTAEQVMEQPFFACHMGAPGNYSAPLVCAGWLAAFGWDSIRARLTVSQGTIPGDALEPGANWPPLYESWATMVAAQTWRPGDPDDHLTMIDWESDDD